MPKIKWREAVKSGEELSDKMIFDIRKRATQMMADLQLICERLPERQKIRIFQNPRTYDTIMWPAMVNLMMSVGYIPQSVRELHKFKNSKEIQALIKGLESHGIKYDFALLFENQDYLKSKKDALRIKTET